MRYRQLGESELKVSEICLGTMTFGIQNSEAEGHAQLDLAVDQGVNFIDTAEMYPVPPSADSYGRTEQIVGTWLRRQPRDRIVIATKVAGPSRNLRWIRGGPLALDRANIRTALDGSLRRLQTDYVDLYQLHWPDRNTPMFGKYQFDPAQERATVPIAAQLEALSELIGEGKIRHIGVSNEHPWGMSEFLLQAKAKGLARIVSVQNAYSLINRSFETALAEQCYRERIGLLAYSPLAFGLLSGKYVADPAARGRVTMFDGFAQRYGKPNVRPAVESYVELAKRHGMPPAVLALAFVLGRWFVASAIVGATSLVQLEQNLSACQVDLAADLTDEIDQIYLRYTNPAP